MTANILMISAALVLVQAALFSCKPSKKPEYTILEALCKGKRTELTTRSEFENLRREMRRHDIEQLCDRNLRSALEEFDMVLGSARENVCTENKTKKIKSYYRKHIDTSCDNPSYRRLPKPLVHFVLAYAMQVSNLCRKNMLEELADRADRLVSDSDIEHLLTHINSESYVGALLDYARKPGDIMMPIDTLISTPDKTDTKRGLYADISAIMDNCRELRSIKTVCECRLKFIYGPLIMPLHTLDTIGIKYKDERLNDFLKQPKYKSLVTKWSNIAYFCEVIKAVAKIKEKESSEMEQIDACYYQRKQIKYDPDFRVTIGDIIYDKMDKTLVNSIDSFNRSFQEDLRRVLTFGKLVLGGLVRQIKAGAFKRKSLLINTDTQCS